MPSTRTPDLLDAAEQNLTDAQHHFDQAMTASSYSPKVGFTPWQQLNLAAGQLKATIALAAVLMSQVKSQQQPKIGEWGL